MYRGALERLRDDVRADHVTLGAHPPQVLAQEHDRLQPERAARLRPARRHPGAPHGRLRGHARLRGRRDAAHGPRAAGARHGAALLRGTRRGGRCGRPSGGGRGGCSRDHGRRLVPRGRRRKTGPIPSRSADGTAAILAEFRARTRTPSLSGEAVARAQDALSRFRLLAPRRFSTDARERDQLWRLRKGLFASVGALRPRGTAVVMRGRRRARRAAGRGHHRPANTVRATRARPTSIIFGHAKDGNLHFVLAEDIRQSGSGRPLRSLHAGPRGRRGGEVRRRAQGRARLRAATWRRSCAPSGVSAAYAVMWRIKRLLDPDGILNPGCRPERRPARRTSRT